MSTSTLYVLNTKSTTHFAEFRNGWGSGPVAWYHLAEKYIPEKPAYSLSESHLKKVWALCEDPRLQPYEICVLMMTFDRSFVPIHSLHEAAQACKLFAKDSEHMPGVNHWQAIGEALERAAGTKFGRNARGICLSCTSVSDPWIQPSKEQLGHAWPIAKEMGHEPA